ncbi:transposase [Echinicola sp. 20G]|uniref:REP-associated tyrosine transposase n=1 Tax=Echinicola sp. 20G TaxID=2781961 RepID=UPI00191012CF|nr:transposase [Echinicola sp. 20G]
MSGDQYKITDQNAVYFLTFTVVGWLDVFTRKEYKLDITDALNFCHKHKGLIIYSWCLMSNHLHLICRAEEPHQLSGIIRDFKKYTAKTIIRRIENEPESRSNWMLNQFEYAGRNLKRIKKYKFWKDDNHASLLESNKLLTQKLNYIHCNPVRALIVEESEDYLFSSARDYCGIKGLVEIEYIG